MLELWELIKLIVKSFRSLFYKIFYHSGTEGYCQIKDLIV